MRRRHHRRQCTGRRCRVFDCVAQGGEDRRQYAVTSMRVLIVDDEEVLRDVLEVVLRREGFDVVSAASGEEALNLLDGEEVDLVILDVMLPGISGIDTLRAIRID